VKPCPILRIIVLTFWLTAMAIIPCVSAGQLLHNQVPSVVKSLPPVDHLDGSTRLRLAIGLPLRHPEILTNLLRDLYDPASPRFHQYLTAAQFADQFGPTAEDYQAVQHFARAHGLTVAGTHSNRTLLDVTGAVADIENALHVRMRIYKHPTEPRNFYAPDTDPSLDLDTPVLSISGLDNFVLPRPMNLKSSNSSPLADVTGSGPSGYFLGGDFRAAYAPGVALNGAGQSLGLFELDGYYPGDISDYEILAKLPSVALTNILLDGFSGTPGSENIEVALDIDMAICMAPGLFQVMVYEGSGSTPNDILNRMATDNQARQLSSSWSFAINASTEQIFLQFAAQGQSMFQASGDSGAYTGAIPSPSDDPNITIVGGTSLTTTGPGGAWASETAWSGSGGGISTTYPIPSWQQGVNMSSNLGSTTMRNIPDVSSLADVLIWLIANNGQQQPIGGTSAATPLWAGFIALANQQAAANGRPSVGFINPAIYAIGEGAGYDLAFHDITTGNDTNNNTADFFAVPGYDLCTGWGSPAGINLINALVSPPDPLSINPATNLVVSGPAAGPFLPASQTLLLTNIGTNSLNWVLGDTASWLNVSPGSGILLPGAPPVPVTLTVNAAASNLLAGAYTATVWFTNLSDGFAQSRAVVLDVIVPPAITQQPASQNVPLGGTATFTVGTASNPALSFQWQDNGTNLADGGNIFGSAASTLTVSNVTATNTGTYKVVVSNAAGSVVSTGANLAITSSAPLIITQPVSQAEPQGAVATFTVIAAGNAPLIYQWKCNNTNLTDGPGISGSASNILTLGNVSPANAGAYSVIVTNNLGSASSAAASLTVLSLTAPGVALSTLYSFTGETDGANPNGLMQETNGNFYGTTQDGGANDSGTVFQMTPLGAVTTLDLFNEAGTGAFNPTAALLQGLDGNLYGTTEYGGANGWGTIFQTTTNGVLTDLVDFDNANGSSPYRALTQGADGGIYGATVGGGAASDGTIFRVTTNGTLASLFSFNGANGINPNELVQTANGIFYGTTYDGGANGNGTIFQVTSNGALTSLDSFNYTNGGSLPYAGLTAAPDGNFLGTTYEGGAYGYGTVFQVSPAGAVTTIYAFTGQGDGGHPAAGLVQGSDGNYYGTTAYGGTYDEGAVFRLAPNGDLLSLVQFDGYDGANPQAPLIFGADGSLYGATENGGADDNGVIFRININAPTLQITTQPADQNAYIGTTVLFSVAVVGNAPISYQWKENGTNLMGSTNRILTLLDVSPASSGVYSVLVSNATSSILSDDASLGVITSPPQITVQPASQTQTVGGTAVFSVTAVGDLPLSYQWQENGTNLVDGGQISGSSTSTLAIDNLLETNDGSYSVIVSNSVASVPSLDAVLTVFAASASGTTMANLHSFTGGADGGDPNSLIQGADGLLYGATQTGGAYGDGTLFTLSTNGALTTLLSFDGANGAIPVAALVQDTNGILYGTTKLGGSNSAGTLFSITTNGVFDSIYSFANTNDSIEPFTPLIQDGAGNFYGATSNNALPGDGNIFKIAPGGFPATLYAFPGGLNGTSPVGALALGNDGNFYGMTLNGGSHSEGNVFKMTPAGVLTNLYSFTGGADGYAPIGQLALGADGNFYGVTRRNTISGLSFYGTIFKITPAGALTTLYSLNGIEDRTDGAYPFAGLIQGSDGNFYGVTLTGFDLDLEGTIYDSSDGTVFRVTPSGAYATLTDFNNSDDGSSPEASLVEASDGSLYGTTTTGGPGGHGTIFRLAFTAAPQILTQPASQTNLAGASVSLSVTVFGAPPLYYQWQQNGTNLPGANSRVLTLDNLSANQAGTYSVIVSNALGTATSGGATLTIEMGPFLQTLEQNGNTLSFIWSVIPGQSYQVQSTASLSSPAWTNQTPALLATNTLMSLSDLISPTAQKFYRVILLP
jgi:uncharacterized repeat protein (TIGR03803 family)